MKRLMNTKPSNICFIFGFSILLILFAPIRGHASNQQIDWVFGPAIVDLGEDLAQIDLDEEFVFANPEDTRILMEEIGNPPSGREIGLIIPKVDNPKYFIVLEYFPVGYVKDDEKESIDGDAILESIRQGTEHANKLRQEKGFAPLNVVGWYEEPHYDIDSHNLVWAIVAESGENQVVNYDVRLLGRHGYISAVLVTDPETLQYDKRHVEATIANLSYKQGRSYAEYVKGDKVAKIGLTALIAGGAATVAAKTGLLKMLAKSWKLVFAGLAAFFGALGKTFKSLFGKKKESEVA
jgi:uncharacterized membrane-anchored protein